MLYRGNLYYLCTWCGIIELVVASFTPIFLCYTAVGHRTAGALTARHMTAGIMIDRRMTAGIEMIDV